MKTDTIKTKAEMIDAIIEKTRGTCSEDDLGEYAHDLAYTTLENVLKEYNGVVLSCKD